jgi:hypothetical protein
VFSGAVVNFGGFGDETGINLSGTRQILGKINKNADYEQKTDGQNNADNFTDFLPVEVKLKSPAPSGA